MEVAAGRGGAGHHRGIVGAGWGPRPGMGAHASTADTTSLRSCHRSGQGHGHKPRLLLLFLARTPWSSSSRPLWRLLWLLKLLLAVDGMYGNDAARAPPPPPPSLVSPSPRAVSSDETTVVVVVVVGGGRSRGACPSAAPSGGTTAATSSPTSSTTRGGVAAVVGASRVLSCSCSVRHGSRLLDRRRRRRRSFVVGRAAPWCVVTIIIKKNR